MKMFILSFKYYKIFKEKKSTKLCKIIGSNFRPKYVNFRRQIPELPKYNKHALIFDKLLFKTLFENYRKTRQI